jgi:catechol 2,3-dioxygenase-like lactoylglutathione lyase family enzyme
MTISGFDHLAITCNDVDASIDFYTRVLGAELLLAEMWRARQMPVAIMQIGANRLSLHQAAAPASPHAQAPTPGSVDLCFRWEGPITDAVAHLGAQGVAVIEGPVGRPASNGERGTSVYFRDLDGNLLEMLTLTPA